MAALNHGVLEEDAIKTLCGKYVSQVTRVNMIPLSYLFDNDDEKCPDCADEEENIK